MTVPPAVESAMHQAVVDGVFPGAVLSVRYRSGLTYTVPVGRLWHEQTSARVESSTIYDLASLTKPLVTGTSVALLIQDGRLSSDSCIENVLEDLKGSAIGRATVRDLLAHCSGLPGWRPLYERLSAVGIGPGSPSQLRRDAVLKLIAQEPLVYERGSRSLYSDLGFILLGLLVEQVTEQRLDRWYDSAVALPLQAAPLLFCPIELLDSARIAPTEFDRGRAHWLQGEVHDENAAALGGIAGHAGLFGTSQAVLAVSGAWLRAWGGENGLLRSSTARTFTARVPNVTQSSWALGWDTPSAPSSSGRYFSASSFGHLGYTGTSLWIDPERGLEVVLLSNRVHPTRKNEKIRDFRPHIHDIVLQEWQRSEEGAQAGSG
ncbi:MAG TPA: serine hydrolase [Nitrospira sp.]|nr:serine hydrolase [Nitrospira sp.]